MVKGGKETDDEGGAGVAAEQEGVAAQRDSFIENSFLLIKYESR